MQRWFLCSWGRYTFAASNNLFSHMQFAQLHLVVYFIWTCVYLQIVSGSAGGTCLYPSVTPEHTLRWSFTGRHHVLDWVAATQDSCSVRIGRNSIAYLRTRFSTVVPPCGPFSSLQQGLIDSLYLLTIQDLSGTQPWTVQWIKDWTRS